MEQNGKGIVRLSYNSCDTRESVNKAAYTLRVDLERGNEVNESIPSITILKGEMNVSGRLCKVPD